MGKLFLVRYDQNIHNRCCLCRYILTMPNDNKLTGSIFANVVNRHTHISGEEQWLGDLKMFEATYDNGDLVLQFLLKQKALASLCKAYPRDFTVEPMFIQSTAERVGLELYAIVNGFIPNN